MHAALVLKGKQFQIDAVKGMEIFFGEHAAGLAED